MRLMIKRVFVLAILGLSATTSEAQLIGTTNLLTNAGAETGSISGWTATGANPTVDNGAFDPGINPHSGTYDFVGGPNSQSLSQGTLYQVVGLVGVQGITAAALDSGMLQANLSFWEQSLNQGADSDAGKVTLDFLNSTNTTISTVSSPYLSSTNGTWENYQGSFAIPTGTRSIEYTMVFQLNAGVNIDSFIDDNSLTVASTTSSSVPEPGSLTLAGLLFSCAAIGGYWRRRG